MLKRFKFKPNTVVFTLHSWLLSVINRMGRCPELSGQGSAGEDQ